MAEETKQNKPRPLTIKQRKFIDEVIKTGNATQAVKKAGYKTTEWSARSIGSENLTKPNIKAEIENRLRDAKNMIYTIAMTGEKEDTRLRASQDIVDRVEGKAVQKVEQKMSWDVSLDISIEQKQKLLSRLKLDE